MRQDTGIIMDYYKPDDVYVTLDYGTSDMLLTVRGSQTNAIFLSSKDARKLAKQLKKAAKVIEFIEEHEGEFVKDAR